MGPGCGCEAGRQGSRNDMAEPVDSRKQLAGCSKGVLKHRQSQIMAREGLTWGRATGRHGTSQRLPERTELRFLEYPHVLPDTQGSVTTRKGENTVGHVSLSIDLQSR